MTPLEHIMGLMDPSYPEPIRRSMAQGILDKHAHELAEQQRAHADTLESYSGLYDSDQLHSLPDLIDPHAQRANSKETQP